ncbi:protein DpdD [Rhodococcus zopfii]|uniref:protein DpdD n=1 Tax=Rhodococcus zopfii TaxID=43772 RepID=UPI0036623B62
MNELIEEFFGPHNEVSPDKLDQGLRTQLNDWIRSLSTGNRTSFLPRSHRGRLFWYVFAPNDRRANEILELLGAWIGPTYSDISQNHGRLDLTDPFDHRIETLTDAMVIRFEVLPRTGSPDAREAKEFVRNALVRLTNLLDNRPPSEFRLTKSTSEILDDLGHALSARDRTAAEASLHDLATNGDLDAVNLSFVRIRTLASLGDWNRLLADRAIDDILRMNRPPGVTRSIRRAVYHTYLATLDRSERDIELLSTAKELPEKYRSIGRGPKANHRDELILQVLLTLHSGSPTTKTSLDHLIADADALEIGLEPRLRRLVEASALDRLSAAVSPTDPATAAAELYDAGDTLGALEAALRIPVTFKTGRIAISAAADLANEASARLALDYVDRAPDIRATLAGNRSIQRNLAELERLVTSQGPQDWSTWFDQISNGADVATVSATIPDDFENWATLTFDELERRLRAVSDDALIVLGETSGQFLAAHRDVLEKSDAVGAGIGRRLLEALSVGGKCSRGIQAQTLNIVDLAFSSSFSPDEYAGILEHITEIRRTNSAPSTVDWQLDLLQLITAYPNSDKDRGSLEQFVVSCLTDLIKHKHALSFTATSAIRMVCDETGIDLPDVFKTPTPDEIDELGAYSYLRGKTIALYSLMEPASARAAQLLRRIVPDLDVRLFTDKVGSTPLASASENADIFVIVTAAAKHAATEFIAAHRGARPTILVNSKGTSAILRSLRETA